MFAAMSIRDRILEATARVYAEHGYRGATTRRIAEEAGVNEVTIFRHFGSKGALIEQAVRHHHELWRIEGLPQEPGNPVEEVTAWCLSHYTHLKRSRGLFRKFMCDMQHHPEMRASLRETPVFNDTAIIDYIERLRELGIADKNFDIMAAVQMLRGALFGDVMGRDMVPHRLPQPEREAPRLYAHIFLRAIGVTPSDADVPGAPSRARGPKGTTTKRTRR